MENKILSWSAQEFKIHKKNTEWYIGYLVFAFALLAYGWYSHNLLTLVTFAIIVVVVFYFSHQSPGVVKYELTSTGVMVGKTLIPYRSVKKFWIIYTSVNKSVNFETSAYLNNQVSLQLGKQDPLPVREFLKKYLSEDLDREESFTEVLARKIKF